MGAREKPISRERVCAESTTKRQRRGRAAAGAKKAVCAREGERGSVREGAGLTVHVFSTSTQPRWRRIAAQCSSNGAVLRRDHAAAPCTTDQPISGTRDQPRD
uniref:Uncharacterized protein n=1 Tax=Vespula pensylvanica TaxID=30213 RepID=A0A834NBZ2_VESPE|nr:hypothetical protein H0235_015189 [Vespula pensylvanica]